MSTTIDAPVADAAPVVAPATRVTAPKLHECPDCGQMQILPAMPPQSRAVCLRCDAVLRHTRRDPFAVGIALNLAALILFGVAGTLTIMSVTTGGQHRAADLVTGPAELGAYGLWELSVVVMVTTFAAPLARTLCMLTVLIGLHSLHPPKELRSIFAWVKHLRPWSMIEIYMLGLFVAYVRLSDMARIDLGPAVFALAGLMVILVAADFAMDEQAVWEAMEPPNRRQRLHARAVAGGVAPDTSNRWRIGCDVCGLVARAAPGMPCLRCGYTLQVRKHRPLEHTWALSIAALALYIPANTYPVLTVIRLGAGQPSTILGGVLELIDYGMWPLALLVFFASVAVPVLKLVGLAVLLVTTHRKSAWALRNRTVLYRVIDAIGRWSMIDIFMESILVALVQFGPLATVYPGPGAIAFSAVVILTMLAARSFDPRLMWDRVAEGDPA